MTNWKSITDNSGALTQIARMKTTIAPGGRATRILWRQQHHKKFMLELCKKLYLSSGRSFWKNVKLKKNCAIYMHFIV